MIVSKRNGWYKLTVLVAAVWLVYLEFGDAKLGD